MRRLLLGGAAALLMTWAGPSFAQLYVGTQVGADFTNTEIAAGGGSIINGLGGSGVEGGVRAGYDYRIPGTPMFVGVMGEYDWSNSSFNIAGTPAATVSDEYLGVGRLGVVWANGSKTYALLGAKHMDLTYGGALSGATILPKSFNGLTAGLGFAVPITHNLDFGLEGRYTDYQSSAITGSSVTFQPRELEALAVLTFHFGGSDVVAASKAPLK